MTPYLTDAEIAEICAPLEQPAAQARYLAGLGLRVERKPNGRPLIARGEWDRVMVGTKPAQAQAGLPAGGQPDAGALVDFFTAKRGKRHGQAA